MKDHYDSAEQLHDAIAAAFFGRRLIVTKSTKRVAMHTAMALLTKAAKTHRAVNILARNGLGQDAQILARSMYETMLMLLFIFSEDDGENARAAMVHGYALEQQLKMLKKWNHEEIPSAGAALRDELIAQAESDLQVAKTQMPADVTVKKHWSGLPHGLEDAAKFLEHNRSYQTLYRIMSRHSHGTDFTDHVERGIGDEPWTLNVCPSEQSVASALAIAKTCLWVMADRLNSRLGLGLQDTLDRFDPSNQNDPEGDIDSDERRPIRTQEHAPGQT